MFAKEIGPISKKGIKESEGRLSSTVDDVRQWEPSMPETNVYDTSELTRMYGQSFDELQMGKAMVSAAMNMMQESVNDFKGRLGLLEAEAAQAEQDIYSDDPLTRAEAKLALDQNLQQQSRMGKDMDEGSAAWTQAQELSAQGASITQISAATGAAGSNENLAKKAQQFDAMNRTNQSILAALGGAASGTLAQQQLGASASAAGLSQMGTAAGNMAEQRLRLAQQGLEHGSMKAGALKSRMGAATSRATAQQAAYLKRHEGRLKANKTKRATNRKIRSGVFGALGSVGGAVSTMLNPKKAAKAAAKVVKGK